MLHRKDDENYGSDFHLTDEDDNYDDDNFEEARDACQSVS